MAKNNEKNKKHESAGGSYDLKTDAVNRLVNADKKTYPDLKADPGKKYRSGGFIDKIPSPIKALVIKFWFAGAVCFFIYWGLGMYLQDTLDMMVVLGVVMGMVTDVLVNNAFHFFAVTPGSNNKWMMFPKRKFWTFFTNIIYGILLVYLVATAYTTLNTAINALCGTENTVYVGVEPILFGMLYVAFDMLFIGIKTLTLKIISDAKKRVDSE